MYLEYHSVYLDACTLVKANLFGDLTFSVGYSLSMWIAIQLQLDSNSGQWWEVFFSLNTGFFCSCSMLMNYTLLGSSYQSMSYWIKNSDILHPSTRVSHSDLWLLNLRQDSRYLEEHSDLRLLNLHIHIFRSDF